VVKMLLDKPEDKSRVKELAQKIQKFYFGDKRITYAPDSGIVDVSVFGFRSLIPHRPRTVGTSVRHLQLVTRTVASSPERF
jgi:hypothetical protein